MSTPPRSASELAWLNAQAALLLPGALVALVLTLPSWRYFRVWTGGPPDVFFELRSVFIYLADLPALIAVGAWLLTPFSLRVVHLPRWLVLALGLLALLATLSAFWAPLRIYALYQACRLWLLYFLFLVVATTWEARGAVVWGLLISGALQAAIGVAQFLAQHTLGLSELGEIVMRPEWSGASIVTVNGAPTLRAYGLTQHPNLLGGFLAVAVLMGVGQAALRSGDHRASLATAIGLTGLAFAGLLLTFSRGAWLGLASSGIAMLLLLWRPAIRAAVNWRAAGVLLGLLVVIGAIFVATQWPQLQGRLGLAVEGQEIRSVDERAGLVGGAWALIEEQPWLGTGYANFAIALWQRKPPALEAYPIYQPVHNSLLLAVAELGVPGGVLWLALALGPWLGLRRQSWPVRGPGMREPGMRGPGIATAAACAIAALTVVSWFDFYPWFSQQGRLLNWLCWGLWAQSVTDSADHRRGG